MEKNYDDTFLARWAAGELTPEELQAFEKSTEYSEYKMISEGANRLEAPSFDRQALWQGIQKQTSQKTETKVRRLPSWIWPAAAAAVLLLVGYFTFLQTSTFTTQQGETFSFELPDTSQVILNAVSEASFNKRSWSSDRSLELDGQAYFEVAKGSVFEVITSEGTVQVTGTEFSVNARERYFEVICYEGSVRVESREDQIDLTPGQAVRWLENQQEPFVISEQQPAWLSNNSRFVRTPLAQVVDELQRQFEIEIKNKELLPTDARFTGSFSHEDKTQAIETVFVAMQINYTFDGNSIVVIQK